MTPLMFVLVVVGGSLMTGALTSYALVGVTWLVAYPSLGVRFPRRWAVVFAVIISVIALGRELPGALEVLGAPSKVNAATELAAIFSRATQWDLTEREIQESVRDIDFAGWSPTDTEVILESLSLKAERYIDLYQSSLLGKVVVTPAGEAFPSADFATLFDASGANWLPLLEAAASGSPVVFPDGTSVSREGLYFLSLNYAWARWAVFTAVERLHSVQTPLTQEDREVGPTLGWLESYADALAGDEALAIQLAVADVGQVFDTSVPISANLIESVRYLTGAMGQDFVRLLAYLYEVELVEIDTWKAVAGGESPNTNSVYWSHLTQRRRLLGLPEFDPDHPGNRVWLEMSSSWGQAYMAAESDLTALRKLEIGRNEVEERFELLTSMVASL